MESRWRMGPVLVGRDCVRLVPDLDRRPTWIRGAQLVEPFPWLGAVYKSVWQTRIDDQYAAWLNVSDLSDWASWGLPYFWAFGPGFPYGFDVIADDVPF